MCADLDLNNFDWQNDDTVMPDSYPSALSIDTFDGGSQRISLLQREATNQLSLSTVDPNFQIRDGMSFENFVPLACDTAFSNESGNSSVFHLMSANSSTVAGSTPIQSTVSKTTQVTWNDSPVSPSVSEHMPLNICGNEESRSPLAIPSTSNFQDCPPSTPSKVKEPQPQVSGQQKRPGPMDDCWIKRLANNNIELYEHSVAIPRASTGETTNKRDGDLSATFSPGGNGGLEKMSDRKPFAIDRTLELSRELIDILSEIDTESEQPHRLTNRALETLEFLDEPGSKSSANPYPSRGQDDKTQKSGSIGSLDPGTSLLILSGYIRILDIYAKYFGLISISLSTTKGKDLSQHVQLPGVVIGTFSLRSSPALQITLIIRLVEEVFECLRNTIFQADLVTSKDEDPDYPHSSIFYSVPEVTLQAIRVQESKIMKSMNDLRRRLQQS